MLKNFPKMVRSAFAVGLSVCALAACTPNPNGLGVDNFGTVTGRVLDRDSLQPISGATISIGNIVSITAAIDAGGFVLRNVPVGSGSITISAVGWQSYRGSITVVKDQATDVGVIGLPSSLNR
jgi:hypothetical protein